MVNQVTLDAKPIAYMTVDVYIVENFFAFFIEKLIACFKQICILFDFNQKGVCMLST